MALITSQALTRATHSELMSTDLNFAFQARDVFMLVQDEEEADYVYMTLQRGEEIVVHHFKGTTVLLLSNAIHRLDKEASK